MCVFADKSSPAVVVVTDQQNFFPSVNLVQRTYAVTVLRRAPQLSTHCSGTPRVTLRFSGRTFQFIKRPMAAHRKRHGHPFVDLDV